MSQPISSSLDCMLSVAASSAQEGGNSQLDMQWLLPSQNSHKGRAEEGPDHPDKIWKSRGMTHTYFGNFEAKQHTAHCPV